MTVSLDQPTPNDRETAPALDALSAVVHQQIKDCRVLIVDDNSSNRRILTMSVKKLGVLNVETAENGAAGLEAARRLQPDLVLLDVIMPEMDGFEMCRRLREDSALSDVPVLIQTALTEGKERAKGFAAGASDLISRPFDYAELGARIRIHLERRLLLRDLRARYRRMSDELEAARSAQMDLIPSENELKVTAENYGIRIDARFIPSSELGGDYWTLFDLGDGQLGILLADFTGHGVRAALNTFRLTTLIRQMPPDGHAPAAWLAILNDPLNALLSLGEFATVFYGVLDTRARSLTYAAAGSPRPAITSGDTVTYLETRGMFLGLLEGAAYEDRTISLPPSSSLLLYSDEVIENRDAGRVMLEEEGLMEWLPELEKLPFSGRLDELLRRLRQRGGPRFEDDLTAVLIGFQETN